MKTYTQSVEHARKQVDQLFQRSDFPTMLSQSTTGILGILFAIQEEQDAEGWAKRAVDEEGRPLLTPAEQAVWTAACEPYLPFFRRWSQQGGADLPSLPSAELPIETAPSETSPEESADVPMGPDDLFEKAYSQYEKVNSTIHQYVSKHGPLQMSTFDKGEDLPVFPKAITTALQAYPATKAVGMALEKVKAPPRTLYVIVYLLLDMARVSASVMGADQNRKLLSVIMSILDLLRGDWKKAILSLLGYAGSSPMYMGQLLKAYVALFEMIHPRIQREIVFGTYSLGKSLLIGGLLAVFQVTAPASARVPLIEMLEKLAERKQAIDDVLIGQGLAPRSDELSVSFEHIERLQALMDDQAFICSKEYQELTQHVQGNFALRMVFQLVGIPTSDTFREQRCGKGPSRPLAELVVKESLAHPQRTPEELHEKEPELPTVEATNEQVESAIQTVDQKAPEKEEVPPTIQKPSLEKQEEPEESPTIQKPLVEKQEEPEASLPPTIQKKEEPSLDLPPTIRPRGGRSLRRGH